MARVQLEEPRIVCHGHHPECCARDGPSRCLARTAFAIESGERVLQADTRFEGSRGPVRRVQRRVRPGLRKRALPQDPLENKTSDHRTQKDWQVREFRWRSSHDIRGFVQRARNMLHDLARRPLSWRARRGPGCLRPFCRGDQSGDGLAMGSKRCAHIHVRLQCGPIRA